jgi:type II secretory pathway component PulK
MRGSRCKLSGQRGVALIVVLWAVALISAAMLGLAAILQRQLAQEVAALQNSRATLVAESGLQMALNPAIQPSMAQEASRVLSGELQQGWGGVEVRFEVKAEDLQGEDGRINLNALAMGDREFCRRVLTNLLGAWDVSPTSSSAFIDGLLDYVDPDDQTTGNNDATEEGVKDGALERLEELEQIAGWRQVLAESKEPNWREKFTIYGSGKLSLKSADQDVIEAWLTLNPGAAANFIQARLGPDGIEGSQDDIVNVGLLRPLSEAEQAQTNLGNEDLWRVTSTGEVGGVKRKVVALISRNPPQIKARWMEEREP